MVSEGLAVRTLDPADETLHLVVHAAIHGAVHTKWLLDLHALALDHGREVWEEAARRAKRSRAAWPFWAGAQLISPAISNVPREVARSLRPPWLLRPILRWLVAPRQGPTSALRTRIHALALAWCLEERADVRVHRLIGFLERVARKLGVHRPRRHHVPAAIAESFRWVEGALRRGDSGPLWLTLRGTSMAPVLKDGDRLLVAPCRSGHPPPEGAIVITRQPAGLVAHRLLTRSLETAVTRGDACWRDDSPIPASELLGEVIGIAPRTQRSGPYNAGFPKSKHADMIEVNHD
jgi:hypothetical protein